MRDLLCVRTAADIKKVRGQAASVLDDIHRGHRQSGAVHHAAHAALELDVVQAVLGGLNLERIFLRNIAQFANVGMAEERVVVEGQLGIESEKPAIGGSDEGIDLEERSISIEKRLIETGKKLHGGIDLFGIKSKRESHLARLKGFQAHARIDVLLQNGAGIFRGHLLNLHTTRCRCHEHRLAFRAVDENAEVQLVFDRQSFFYQ